MFECTLAPCLLAQPKRAHEGDLRTAVRRLAAHGPRPKVSDRRRAARILRVQIGQLPLGLTLDLRADAAQVISELRAVPREVLQHHLEDQAGNGVKIARERLAAEPQCLQGDRTAARKRVHNQRRFLAVGRLHQCPADLEIGLVRGEIPAREAGNEHEQRVPQVLVRCAWIAIGYLSQKLSG